MVFSTAAGEPMWKSLKHGMIGAAWASKDGKSFVLQLHCVPLDGRVVLRQPDAHS